MRVMFDTNAVNALVKEGRSITRKSTDQYFCTNLQKAELRRTANEEMRKFLLSNFEVIKEKTETAQISQRSTPWGSPWGSPWDSGGEHYTHILAGLEALKPGDRGNSYDAVLIETCIYESLVFISNDSAARTAAGSFGVQAMPLESFVAL
jgi:hypothetical protein